MSRELKNIGLKIRELRDLRGLSQSHCAEIAGVNRTYFGKIERGEVNFTLEILFAVAKTLKVSPRDLLVSEDE